MHNTYGFLEPASFFDSLHLTPSKPNQISQLNHSTVDLTMSSQTPPFYSIFFKYIDPLICLSGALTTLFLPHFFLDSYFSHPTITPEVSLLLNICAGFFASTLLLQLVLLRLQPIDVRVWKALQGAILVQDLAVIGAFLKVAAEEGRLGFWTWRLAEWGNLLVVGGVGTIRAAFLFGIGMDGGKGGKAR